MYSVRHLLVFIIITIKMVTFMNNCYITSFEEQFFLNRMDVYKNI